jgi:hypothetical protein
MRNEKRFHCGALKRSNLECDKRAKWNVVCHCKVWRSQCHECISVSEHGEFDFHPLHVLLRLNVQRRTFVNLSFMLQPSDLCNIACALFFLLIKVTLMLFHRELEREGRYFSCKFKSTKFILQKHCWFMWNILEKFHSSIDCLLKIIMDAVSSLRKLIKDSRKN